MTPEESRWMVSVHEAGHACIAHICRGQIKSATVDPNGQVSGEVYATFDRDDWRGLVTFLMAGYWAQHHVAGCLKPWDYARIDRQLWQEALRKFDAADGVEDELFELAERLVLESKEVILDVAALLDAGSDVAGVREHLMKRRVRHLTA